MSAEITFGLKQDNQPATLSLKRANRHGFITGATGTGKTVTLQTIVQNLALAGVPVFAVDVKGDLSGIATAKDPAVNLPTTEFWDVFGTQGIPVRTTISEFGPILLARLLELSDAQTGVLEILFKIADAESLLLLDIADLQAMLRHVGENAKQISQQYGLVSPASIAAIQRQVLRLETQGAAHFFGEPAMDVRDLIRQDTKGFGVTNILAATKLVQYPGLYATFLLWLLAELYETLPEAGDLPQPKLCLFFDEAHLMFDDAPKILLDKVEQVVRLIRSKGVGVYFVTQNPLDIPETILAQLGNRFQHALRAYTPKETKAIRILADTFRANPAFDTEKTLVELGIGEALVSTLDDKGVPTVVEKIKINLPPSTLGALGDTQRQQIINASLMPVKYATGINRDSAAERLDRKAPLSGVKVEKPEPANKPAAKSTPAPRASNRQSPGEALVKSVLRAAGSQVGRQIGNQLLRGIMGAITRR